MSDPNVEEDEAGAGIVDDDVLHGEPQEELLLGQPHHPDEAPVGEVGLDDAVEEDPVLELGQAGPVEEHLQPAVAGEGVGPDLTGEEAGRQAPGAEEVVDGGGLRRGRRGEGGEDEACGEGEECELGAVQETHGHERDRRGGREGGREGRGGEGV